jgi:hypothetical protein
VPAGTAAFVTGAEDTSAATVDAEDAFGIAESVDVVFILKM